MTAKPKNVAAPTDRSSLLMRKIPTFIESLAMAGHKVDLEGGRFYYMNAVTSAYDLIIVEHSEVDEGSHFTLTGTGIIHNLGREAEFTKMEQYEREYYLYHMVLAMPFFQQHRLWKCFNSWKTTVRQTKIVQASNSLKNNLFVLNPILYQSLIDVRQRCHQITSGREYRLFNIEPHHTYTLEEFVLAQRLQKDSITELFQTFSRETRELIIQSCDETLQQFLKDNGFLDHKEAADFYSRTRTRTMSDVDLREANLRRMQTGASKREISFTERAAMRTQCRRLAKYIRLCDFLVVDAFLSLALICTEELLSYVNPTTSNSR